MPPKTPEKIGLFKMIPASIYSPKFYGSIGERTFGSAFKYLLLTNLLFTLIVSIFLSVPVLMNRDKVDGVIDQALNIYPEELVVTIQDGIASTNVEEPYVIPLDFFKEEQPQNNSYSRNTVPKNLIVIDTTNPFSFDEFYEYETIGWLSQDSLYLQDDNGVQTLPLTEAEDIVIDKTLVDTFLLNGWDMIKPFIAIGIAFVILFMYIGIVLWRMAYSLFLGVLIWVVGAILSVKLDYGSSYKMSYHAMTLAMIIGPIIHFTSTWTGWNGFGFMFTFIALIVTGINLAHAKRDKFIKTT